MLLIACVRSRGREARGGDARPGGLDEAAEQADSGRPRDIKEQNPSQRHPVTVCSFRSMFVVFADRIHRPGVLLPPDKFTLTSSNYQLISKAELAVANERHVEEIL